MDTHSGYKPFRNMEGLSYKKKGLRRPSLMLLLVVLILLCGVLMTVLNIYQLQQMKEEHDIHTKETIIVEGQVAMENDSRKAPVVWIQGKRRILQQCISDQFPHVRFKLETGYLNHIRYVFQRLGFVITTTGEVPWDVLWVHDYPFITMAKTLQNLKPHQKVNHFPGLGFITNKGSLATSQSKAIPTAFKIPKAKEQFLQYSAKYPDKLWVQKNNNHRGIRIKAMEELDLTSDGTFVQEFISKPLLVDGRKFDIGIYTILTSLNPMRLYILEDEALIRFCPTEYYPFDAADVNKYVVHDSYKPMWEMPSLSDMYVNKKYGFKETLNRHFINEGKNISKIWVDMYDTINTIYLEKYPKIMLSASKYKSTRNFFEMVRFDFVIDENMNVFLMEVNMSPNLSTGHFQGNRLLYEHVIYNLLRLVGVGSLIDNHFHNTNKRVYEMMASDREIAVFSDWCSQPTCNENCDSMKCILCNSCLSVKEKQVFKDAYLEHINRGGIRRVYPRPMTQTEALSWSPSSDNLQVLQQSEQNRHLYMWYIGMCRKDQTFCQ